MWFHFGNAQFLYIESVITGSCEHQMVEWMEMMERWKF